MKESNLNSNIANAAKWSSITEISVKIVTPLINMLLARIISPREFGVVATTTMIVSFADMFADAGFQKYLIQKDFENENEKYQNANVAFWTNLSISLLLCSIIFIFRDQFAMLVGNPGLGTVISFASLQLILTAFSSIQMSLYRRDFDFKTLFFVRIVSAIVPLIITLPLAYLGFGYWSIIVGNMATQTSNALILTIKSKWKPKLYFKFSILKEMFSFSSWSMIESISIWLTTWADTFVISSSLNQYYLGLYKTSTSLVNSLLSIITGATTPVLFASLSRLQNNEEQFNSLFLKFQKSISIFVFPIGIGVYLYSNLATTLLLGDGWQGASEIIGLWALTSSLMIVFGNYASELYRAKGLPKLSFIAQVLHLIVLIPVCIVSARYGFRTLIYARSLVRLQFILVHLILLKFVIKFPVTSIFKNLAPTALSSILMGLLGYYIRDFYDGIFWKFLSIAICALFYFALLMLSEDMRKEFLVLTNRIKQRVFK